MKILFFLAAVAIIGLVITGAITLQRGDDQKITIQIDRGRVKQEAATALEKGKEVLEEAESALHRPASDTSRN
jgi:hypothetical protein